MEERPAMGVRIAPETLGRYRLLRKIAVGGMAEIYLARVRGVGGFEKNVVVKRILPQLAESPEFFRMFLDEARIAATLQHPNVIQVYDAGEENGEYFIAMEYLEGADLLTIQRLASRDAAAIPLENALQITAGVASGLHYAHEKTGLNGEPLHIVHRDVTPHNIFLTRDGGVKLVDFGIAKATNRQTSTSYGTLKGKLAYMSPEQCRGEPVDRRSDIYSLAIVLYELATGARLYQGKSEYLVLREIVEGEVAPPSEVAGGNFPRELEEIIMRGLQKEPARRFENVREMQRRLLEFARMRGYSLDPLGLADWLAPYLSAAREKRRKRQSEHPPRSRTSRMLSQERGYVSADFDQDDEEALGIGVDALLDDLGLLQEPVPGEPGPEIPPGGPLDATPDPTRVEPVAAAARAQRVSAARRTAGAPPSRRHAAARARPAAASEPPGIEPAPISSDLAAPDVRPRIAHWLIPCLLLIGAGGALWYFVVRPQQEQSAGPAEPTSPAAPRIGSAVVESVPAGAEVWLLLGRAPVESPDVATREPHEIFVEHDGYVSRKITVEREDWADGAARVEVKLAPTPVGEAPNPHAGPAPPPAGDAGPPRPGAGDSAKRSPDRGRIRVESIPDAARIWMKVATTPAYVPHLPIDHAYQFRLERDGFAPSFLKIEPADFGADARAHLRTNMALLRPGSEAGARSPKPITGAR